jgi:hypothetical protein
MPHIDTSALRGMAQFAGLLADRTANLVPVSSVGDAFRRVTAASETADAYVISTGANGHQDGSAVEPVSGIATMWLKVGASIQASPRRPVIYARYKKSNGKNARTSLTGRRLGQARGSYVSMRTAVRDSGPICSLLF